ncbi:MAG TPA: hypothetical protein PKY50_03170 [Candidatus Competibacter sp.]|nr:hypothetical protein [Candidatus Competibacter sp.]
MKAAGPAQPLPAGLCCNKSFFRLTATLILNTFDDATVPELRTVKCWSAMPTARRSLLAASCQQVLGMVGIQ